MSKFLFAHTFAQKDGSLAQTIYELPEHDENKSATQLIASSTRAMHPNVVDFAGMKKIRFVGDEKSVVYGPA